MQRGLRRALVGIKARDQRREPRVDGVQPVRQRARLDKAKHRHGAIGLDLAQALHDAAHPPRAGAGADKDGKAHVPGRINAEIARNHRRAIDHPRHGEAFGDEPLLHPRQHLGISGGHLLNPDQQRNHPFARRTGQPGGWKDLRLDRIEGPGGNAGGKGGIGDEFGMRLPFQIGPADLAREVGGARLGMCRAVAVQEVDQMLPVARPVAALRLALLADRQKHRRAGRFQRRKGARVQLIHQLIAQGMIRGFAHVRA